MPKKTSPPPVNYREGVKGGFIMAKASQFRVLTEEEAQKVHEASVQILEETGVIYNSEEVLDIFKKNGAKVEGETVYIPKKMVEKSLESAPADFKLWARNEDNSISIGKEEDSVAIQPNVGPVFVQDRNEGRREGTLDDLVNIYQICQASDMVDLIGSMPVEPNDIPEEVRHLDIMYSLLKHTDKPLVGMVRGKKEQDQMFKMVKMAIDKSSNFFKENNVIIAGVCPLSPLRFDTVPLETILSYAKRSQPVSIIPCALAGATGPVSLIGTAIQQNAEILAGLVLVQLINPGSVVIYMPASTAADMSDASYITGSPEGTLIDVACLQLGNDLYNLPTKAMSSLTDSKLVDCQAGYETMQNIFLLLAAGADIVSESLGVLDSIMTTSYEKLIIDLELLDRMKRILQGVDASTIDEDVRVIKEVGHSGKYLTHPNTFENFRDRWRPSISCWDSYDDWEKEGGEDIVIKANRKYKSILVNRPTSLIDENLDKELKTYIKKLKA